jgi:hypothetical protein
MVSVMLLVTGMICFFVSYSLLKSDFSHVHMIHAFFMLHQSQLNPSLYGAIYVNDLIYFSLDGEVEQYF